jgi:hypothetical protein
MNRTVFNHIYRKWNPSLSSTRGGSNEFFLLPHNVRIQFWWDICVVKHLCNKWSDSLVDKRWNRIYFHYLKKGNDILHSSYKNPSIQRNLLTLKIAPSQHISEGLGRPRGLTRAATQQKTKRNRRNRSRDRWGRCRARSRPKRLPNHSWKDPSGRSTWRIS